MPVPSGPNPFVIEYSVLKDKPNSDAALTTLKRVASLVKPIMRNRNWTLPLLAEFFPDEYNLLGLNINHGEQINIRLRPANSPGSFYDDEQLVLVMLHELTHNLHGPHDNAFYKYLAGLEDEYYALRMSGYAGEGFYSPGHRLGSGSSSNVPLARARALAVAAADRRRVTNTLPQRLGGSNTRPLSARELAAQEAERRALDAKSCGSSASVVIDGFVIDLTDDAFDAIPSRPSASHSSKPPSKHAPTADFGWACPTCTLVNGPLALQCGACCSERPQDAEDPWICILCGNSGGPNRIRHCLSCGAGRQ